MQQRKEENGSRVAKNRSESRSADDEVHVHQTRLVAHKNSLDQKMKDLEERTNAGSPEEMLSQKRAELQEAVDALQRDNGQAGELKEALKTLRDEIEKAQTALDKHDEQEVSNCSFRPG